MTRSPDQEKPSADENARGSPVLTYGIAAMVLYFGVFAAIVLDEVVLRTNWINRHLALSDSTEEFLRLIYAPLIWITLRFL